MLEVQGNVAAIAWLAPLALIARGLASIRTDPVAFDSAVYFEMAEHIRRGSWGAAMAYDFPPLFPLLIAGSQGLGLSAEAAGLAIALAADLLVLLPLVALARAVVGEDGAWGAAFLWAVHPYAVRLGVQALTDAPTAFFVALAVWTGIRPLAMRHPPTALGHMAWAMGAGAASGLGYLMRPEGIEPAIALGVLYGLTAAIKPSADRHPPEPASSRGREAEGKKPATLVRRTIRGAAWTAVPLAGWAIVASPYVAYMSWEAGSLALSKKKSPINMVRSIFGPQPSALSNPLGFGNERSPIASPQPARGLEGPSRPPTPDPRPRIADARSWLHRAALNAYTFQKPLVNGVHPLIILLGGVGAFHLWCFRRPDGGVARRLLAGLAGLHLAVLVGLAAAKGSEYLGGHHFFLLVLYALPFAGGGLASGLSWVRSRLRGPQWLPILMVALVAALMIPRSALRSPGRGTAVRPAATWVRGEIPGTPVVVTNLAKLTYHAGAHRVELLGGYNDILREARAAGAHFVAFYPDMVADRSGDFLSRLNPADLELARVFPEPSRSDPGRRLEIYRVKSR